MNHMWNYLEELKGLITHDLWGVRWRFPWFQAWAAEMILVSLTEGETKRVKIGNRIKKIWKRKSSQPAKTATQKSVISHYSVGESRGSSQLVTQFGVIFPD